ncbi:MAG: response regulator, partial [Methanobacteriota archaeon]
MSGKVRVLIVDDSAYMRVILKDMITLEEDFEVIGTARDGIEALAKIKDQTPDVV